MSHFQDWNLSMSHLKGKRNKNLKFLRLKNIVGFMHFIIPNWDDQYCNWNEKPEIQTEHELLQCCFLSGSQSPEKAPLN